MLLKIPHENRTLQRETVKSSRLKPYTLFETLQLQEKCLQLQEKSLMPQEKRRTVIISARVTWLHVSWKTVTCPSKDYQTGGQSLVYTPGNRKFSAPPSTGATLHHPNLNSRGNDNFWPFWRELLTALLFCFFCMRIDSKVCHIIQGERS